MLTVKEVQGHTINKNHGQTIFNNNEEEQMLGTIDKEHMQKGGIKKPLAIGLGVGIVAIVVIVIIVTQPFSPFSGEDAEIAPRPGEWAASTGCDEFTFTFTVSPDSTGISQISLHFTEFECGNVETTGIWQSDPFDPVKPITGGQFSALGIQGTFDKTGTHASGTWEIDCQDLLDSNNQDLPTHSGTWTASR